MRCRRRQGALKRRRASREKISTEDRLQMQTIQTALAYAQIAKGDGKAAKAAIDAAEKAAATGTAPGTDAFNRQQIRQGVLTRNVENYLRTKDFDTAHTLLNQWELEMPAALWEGFTRTLRVKLAAAEGQPLIAARMAAQLMCLPRRIPMVFMRPNCFIVLRKISRRPATTPGPRLRWICSQPNILNRPMPSRMILPASSQGFPVFANSRAHSRYSSSSRRMSVLMYFSR